jgi:hypothetical protein
MKKEEMFNAATDIANCIMFNKRRKLKARSTILRLIVLGIRESKHNPNIENELKLMADYSER